MNRNHINSPESMSVEAFRGEMTDSVIRRKLDIIHVRVYELLNDRDQLKTSLFVKKYSRMTIQQIAEKWNCSENTQDIENDRRNMALELPEMESALEDAEDENESAWLEVSFDECVFGHKWEDMSESAFDVRPYFQKVCKKPTDSQTSYSETIEMKEFTGMMDLLKMKLEAVEARLATLRKERIRLKTTQFDRKYSRMTIRQIAEEWDSFESAHYRENGRLYMAFELPELRSDFESAKPRQKIKADYINDVFRHEWDHMVLSPFDVRPYFEKYCKK